MALSTDSFDRASPDLLEARMLVQRVDTKFLLSRHVTDQLLKELTNTHALVTANGNPVASYQTHYFDTHERALFRDHLRGRRPRQKIRVRRYLDRKLCFLEVNTKLPSNRNQKARLLRDQSDLATTDDRLTDRDRAFVAAESAIAPGSLEPVIRVDFRRLTLVGIDCEERITFDFGLQFSSLARSSIAAPLGAQNQKHAPRSFCDVLKEGVVIELKQARRARLAPAFRAIRKHDARPSSFSKYCAAMAWSEAHRGSASTVSMSRACFSATRGFASLLKSKTMEELLGVNHLFDAEDFFKLLTRLLLNLLFAGLVIRRYSKLYQNDTYRFTYFIFNIITFSLCFLLRKVPIELGFALGLFAVFGILRYRTEPIGIRDLTYLFAVIGIAILNAVANKKVTLAELLLVNTVVTSVVLILERRPLAQRKQRLVGTYDRLELLGAGHAKELRDDLSHRMGVLVTQVKVLSFDLLRDTAQLEVVYRKAESSTAGKSPQPPAAQLAQTDA